MQKFSLTFNQHFFYVAKNAATWPKPDYKEHFSNSPTATTSPPHAYPHTNTHICTQNTLTENKAQTPYKSHNNTNINQNLQKVLKTWIPKNWKMELQKSITDMNLIHIQFPASNFF